MLGAGAGLVLELESVHETFALLVAARGASLEDGEEEEESAGHLPPQESVVGSR